MFLPHFEQQYLRVNFNHFHHMLKVILSQKPLLRLYAIPKLFIKRPLDIRLRIEGIVGITLFFLHLTCVQALEGISADAFIEGWEFVFLLIDIIFY